MYNWVNNNKTKANRNSEIDTPTQDNLLLKKKLRMSVEQQAQKENAEWSKVGGKLSEEGIYGTDMYE